MDEGATGATRSLTKPNGASTLRQKHPLCELETLIKLC